MVRKQNLWSLITLVVLVGLILASCATAPEPATLRMAVLPILDALPYYVAEARDYFKKYEVEVKAVPVASGLQRDQLMQSGAIDGMLNEMITTGIWLRIIDIF
jgi:NitT/TauT family transport system substrate-binding protein